MQLRLTLIWLDMGDVRTHNTAACIVHLTEKHNMYQYLLRLFSLQGCMAEFWHLIGSNGRTIKNILRTKKNHPTKISPYFAASFICGSEKGLVAVQSKELKKQELTKKKHCCFLLYFSKYISLGTISKRSRRPCGDRE